MTTHHWLVKASNDEERTVAFNAIHFLSEVRMPPSNIQEKKKKKEKRIFEKSSI